jgi:SAM-dependent methyltransferase
MSHYSKEYYNWQKEIGIISGKAQQFLFKNHIKPDDNVLEFGCGGGFLLKNIVAKNKIGIEINIDARIYAIESGLEVVESITVIPDSWADVIISNHVLEHTINPLEELLILFRKLKIGGKIVFVTPHEKKIKYSPDDINQHLFTWSEMNMGNLFVKAGFKIIKVKEVYHRYPPFSKFLLNSFGLSIFHVFAHIYGFFMSNKVSQIQIVATK